MPESKHTPGPWKVGSVAKTAGITVWRGTPPINNDYARICRNVRNLEDARLIAAAPELLEACKEVEAWWLREGKENFVGAPVGIFMLRAAIAKAEPQLIHKGESNGK